MTVAEDRAKLAEIEALIQDGTSSVTDSRAGVSHTRAIADLRIEADRLRRRIATGGKGARMRSVIYNPGFTR